MMKRLLWVLLLAAGPGLSAQQPEPAPPDSARAEQLRAQIEQRFAERVKLELGLRDDQAQKLKATQERYGERRRTLMRGQMDTRQALQLQMRPGVQADGDSVKRLLDRMQRGREDMLKLEADENREMAAYLTPVQQAQFQMLRQRFLDRVQDMRRERGLRGGMMGPGSGPRRGMRPGAGAQRPRRRP